MNTFKKITLTSAVAFALFTFNACGDDSNSTSASGENSSLSSAVKDDESSSSVNGDSSSSVIPDPDWESSSSSVKSSSSSAKSSSSVNSSSSVKSSSSSSAKSSSSSVKSSSSFTSSSSTKPENPASSSSAKSSSSSTPMSSSEYIPYNHAGPLLADSLNSNAYQKFTDSRNGRSYYYLTINGKDGASVTVMAENLNIGEMVNGDKDQTNDSKIERYCYDNDTTKCDKYGGLYQWAEMMQLPSECNARSCASLIRPGHQGICPDGWRLLTHDDFYIVVHADGNVNPLVEGVRDMSFGGHNYSGYGLIGAGFNWGYKFRAKDESAYWHYPEEGHSNDVNIASFVGLQTRSSKSNSTQDTYKTHGFSVRCVKVE